MWWEILPRKCIIAGKNGRQVEFLIRRFLTGAMKVYSSIMITTKNVSNKSKMKSFVLVLSQYYQHKSENKNARCRPFMTSTVTCAL